MLSVRPALAFGVHPVPPLVCRPQNLIAQSQSGTGKTAAFVLAMLSRVNALDMFPQVREGGERGGAAFRASDTLGTGDVAAMIRLQ